MDNLTKIKNLIKELNKATIKYDNGFPIMTDKDWDEKYFQLKYLEKETGIILEDSPTQNIIYKVVNKLDKVNHNHSMLSLDKTKDINEIKAFVSKYPYIAMAKMDGLTCSLTYNNHVLTRAETRGNGDVGEDIYHNALVIDSIPKYIEYPNEVIIDGEIICSYNDFESFSTEYKNPRNFASGSIRLLDSNECKKRKLQFIVWDVIKPFEGISNELIVQLAKAKTLGFTICPFDSDKPVEDLIDSIQKEAQEKLYPIDGVVFKFNDLNLRSSLGQTTHHYKNAIAYKFYDETYPTRLRTIRWTMGRTGVLTPVAIFDPVEIDGSIVEKASLHNVSVMREILGECAYYGEPLEVYKANMIIPQIASAGPKYNYGEVIRAGGVSANDCPEFCPICGHPIEYEKNDGVIIALCSNPLCEGKLINRIEHFAGKKGLDIKGLSLATFGKLMDWDWINSIIDIYSLKDHRDEWVQKPHFGPASVDKILQSIEDTKTTTLNKFIAALGIPLIGNTAANKLVKVFPTYEAFREAVDNSKYHFYEIESFGPEMDESLKEFNYEEADAIYKLLTIPKVEQEENEKKINLNVVITGKLKMFKNRAEFVSAVEKAGGKVASAVSSKTDILVNNDINSQSSKNVTAKKLGIPIMTEEEFFEKYFDTKK